ncbi:MAG: DUF1513 domain-containing protein [Pseudomonadota bacterium]
MPLDRRTLLAAGLASLALPAGGSPAYAADAAFVTCCQRADGRYEAVLLSRDGSILATELLEGRGHGAAISADRSRAVVFARRPGRFAVAFDLARQRQTVLFMPPSGRLFYGHGLFSADGKLLFATENDYENERGVLGIYDATDGFRHVGEWDTHGIGPHEAILMADGQTICVANGGIATHPDFPRQKLNLATMAPSLSYLDSRTGDLIDQAMLPSALFQLSIRHLTETSDRIWFGGQYEGSRGDSIGLVGTHRRGQDPALVEAPARLFDALNHYVGSVASNRDGTRVAAASPRGGRILVFDAKTTAVISERSLPDACGVAPLGDDFLQSGGPDLIAGARPLARHADLMWDNHLRAV